MSGGYEALARAESLVAIARWQEALSVLGPALASEETAPEAHCLAAQCHIQLDQPKAAREQAERALALDPEHPWAHLLLAIASLNSGARKLAGRHAAEAARLAPDSAQALHVLVATQLADNRTADAEKVAAAAVESNPHEPLAHLSHALVSEAKKDWPAAEEAYRAGLRLEPGNSELTLGLARTLHRMGRKRRAEASDAYLAAARADPTDSRARRGLSRLGVPILGFGLFKLFVFFGAQGGRQLDNPVEFAALLGGLILLLGGGSTLLRINAARHLPENVRRGLISDHRSYALGWLGLAAIVAIGLGIWSASIRQSDGGGPIAAAGLLAFGAVALFCARRSPVFSLETAARWGRGYASMFRRLFR